MADLIVDAIYHIMHEHGPSVLTSPRIFETLLSKRVRSSPERAAAIAVVDSGIAVELVARPDADSNALSANLVSRAGLASPIATRSINRWKKALDHLRTGTPPFSNRQVFNVEDVHPPSLFRRGIVAAVFVALTAAIAGALPAVLVGVGVEHDQPTAVRARVLIERREPPGTKMTPRELAGWGGALGGLGGLIGGAIGWLAGGFKQPSAPRIIGAAAGALWAFDGAAFGVTLLGLPGFLVGGLLAAALMSFVGAILGRWGILLLIKPLAWFLVPHF